jgi:class 3 adenylate cyclase
LATTENITVLFTDLVGSTELASALTPEAADGLRRSHFSVLRQAIATTDGIEVKNLGDGLMVVFSAASAALACAVSMQQAVHRDNAGDGRPLGLRVGLSAGEATKEADDYFGDPVIEAARLCARAEAGQILASNLVRAMAGRRSSHTFISLGELELKGLPDPIETLEVGWEPFGKDAPLTTGQVPLPTRLAHRPSVGVIGRENELAMLKAAAKRVASGEGRELVLIAGEPGQGKTTLVSEMARHCHEHGMTVLLGRCDEEVGAPYRPFGEALSHFVAYADEELLRLHVASHGGELARMVPALRQRLGELPPLQTTDADTERYLLYAAVVGLLTSAESTIVLVLDDLHWADKPSLQLLRHVVANSSSTRLLILCNYRDAELSGSHPLNEALAALHREPAGVSTIDLKGLDDTGVVTFVESAAGHELDEAGVGLAHELYRETDGNPFFVYEILRHLSESGAIVQDELGRWVVAAEDGHLTLPHSVRAVIGTRVSRLGGEATKVLSIASVIGRDFDLDLLARATECSEDDLLDILDAATAVALLREVADEPGHYSFSHALIQHTLYQDLGGTRRARAHHRVARSLEEICGDDPGDRVGELAHHWANATQPVDADKAIFYARQAGESALEALAPDEAVRLFTQALRLFDQQRDPDPRVRVDLLIALGNAQRQAGIAAFRETLLDAAHRARQLDDTDRLVAAALANNRGIASDVRELDSEKVAILELALERLAKDSPERALLLATLCTELSFHASFERCLALGEEALAIADASDHDAIVVGVSNTVMNPLSVPELVPQFFVRTADCLQRAERLGDPALLTRSAAWRALTAIRMGDINECDRSMAIADSAARQLDQPYLNWTISNLRAIRALVSGNADEAERIASDAVQLGTDSGLPDSFTMFGPQAFGVAQQRGTLADLIPLIEESEEHSSAVAELADAGLTYAHATCNHTDEVLERLEALAKRDYKVSRNTLWLAAMICYAEAVILSANTRHAEHLLELIEPFGDQWSTAGIVGLQGPASCTLGGLATVLGRYADAEEWFARSARSCEGMMAKYWSARTKLMRGKMLVKRSAPQDEECARSLITDARLTASVHGYREIECMAKVESSKLD